jgi:hypothetical protein
MTTKSKGWGSIERLVQKWERQPPQLTRDQEIAAGLTSAKLKLAIEAEEAAEEYVSSNGNIDFLSGMRLFERRVKDYEEGYLAGHAARDAKIAERAKESAKEVWMYLTNLSDWYKDIPGWVPFETWWKNRKSK